MGSSTAVSAGLLTICPKGEKSCTRASGPSGFVGAAQQFAWRAASGGREGTRVIGKAGRGTVSAIGAVADPTSNTRVRGRSRSVASRVVGLTAGRGRKRLAPRAGDAQHLGEAMSVL